MRKSSTSGRQRGSLAAGFALLAVAAGSAFAQSRPPARGAIPPGTGWLCFEDPLPRGGSAFTCDRPMRACEQLRSARHAAGENVGTCASEPAASCFTYRDNTRRPPTLAHYCARVPAQCLAMRTQVEGSAPMFTDVSACAEFR